MSAQDEHTPEALRLKDNPTADDLDRAENVFASLVGWLRRKL
jgi:hypothetical protein